MTQSYKNVSVVHLRLNKERTTVRFLDRQCSHISAYQCQIKGGLEFVTKYDVLASIDHCIPFSKRLKSDFLLEATLYGMLFYSTSGATV